MSHNYFDITQEFFVVDSEHLDQVKEKLYGFTFVNNTLVEDIHILGDRDPKGNGAYVCVKKEQNQICISQDFIGSYGLYLYKEQDYFALSNSFIALLDHVKQSHKITFNRDFADYMISSDLCSASYAQTMVEEIEILDRCAVIHIDTEAKRLTIDYVDYGENTVELSSREGMEILDAWYHKWTGLIRNLHRETSNVRVDLSGGFDSRIILTLFLGSGIDMNDVFVHSIQDDLHTHAEDYEIASAIGNHYGFALNNETMLTRDCVNYSMDDSINISFYLKLCFHKQMYPRICRYHKPLYYFGGSGGECVRDYWNTTQEEYIRKAVSRCNMFSSGMQEELAQATKNILTASFDGIQKKFESFGRPVAPEDLALNLYRETRCRNHFGKDILENYYDGSVKYAPLLDPDLQRLKLNDAVCPDKNLLMAVIFDRYNRDLLSFKYDSNRSIKSETIEYARKLNCKFPYTPSVEKQVVSVRDRGECIDMSAPQSSNSPITLNDYKATIQEIFYTDRNRVMFELLYGQDLYESISRDIRTRKYQPMQNAYTVIGIVKTLQDVLANENVCCPTIADSFRSNVIKAKSSDEDCDTLLRNPYLENYIALRLDIKNVGADGNDLEITDISDKAAKTSKPAWLAKNGNGYTVESQKGKLELAVRCICAGNLSVAVRGRDVRNKDKERIPFWIDLHSVSVNGEPRITQMKPVWHDEPLRISCKVTDNEVVRICLKWGPHDERNFTGFRQEVITEEKKTERPRGVQRIKAVIIRLMKRLVSVMKGQNSV